jgi:hypothetical protein
MQCRPAGGQQATMKAILFLVGALVLTNIVYATFFAQPPVLERPAAVDDEATRRGEAPWASNERHSAPARDITRKSTLDALVQPWSSFCTEEGANRLVASLNHYYWQRYAEQFSYGDVYGEAGRRRVAKVWTTTDDNRIERLVRETYGRGYLRLDALRSPMRKAVADLVRDERVTGKPCA